MYIVISMPNRKSTASGVSHFMTSSFNWMEKRAGRLDWRGGSPAAAPEARRCGHSLAEPAAAAVAAPS